MFFPFLFYFIIIFFNHFCKFCFLALFFSGHCFGYVFRLCVFVSFNPNCLISFLSSSVCLVVLLLFVLFGSVFVSFMCVCVPCFSSCLILFLPFLQGFVCLFFP